MKLSLSRAGLPALIAAALLLSGCGDMMGGGGMADDPLAPQTGTGQDGDDDGPGEDEGASQSTDGTETSD